jgi:hypothetical protein
LFTFPSAIAAILKPAKPPRGYARWTLRLLENKVVELGIVDRASDSTIWRTFKKNTLQPHCRQCWVIPPEANSAFVASMEDILAVYTRPRDPDRPLACLDETSKQPIAETRVSIPIKPGAPLVPITSTSATEPPTSS